MARLENRNRIEAIGSASTRRYRGMREVDAIESGALWTTAGLSLLILLWSRLGGLDLSLWHDEIATITRFVDGGPPRIFGDVYTTNNHILFSFLTWATVTLGGTTESVFRFWSVVPALVIAGVMFWWLLRRLGAPTASVFLVLLAANPLLTVLSRQARGYGLAMACVGFMTIAAWKALEPDSAHTSLVPLGVAAALGIFTLPTVVLPFVALIPLLYVVHRRRSFWLLLLVGLASLAWYAGSLRALLSSLDQEFGAPLPWHGPLTGPAQNLAFPIIRLLEGGYLDPFRQPPYALSLGTLPLYLLILGLCVLGIARWARIGTPLQAAGVWVPIVGTFLVLTLSRVWVIDRFVSFLGIPVLILIAGGIVEGFRYVKLDRRMLTATAAVIAAFLLSLTVPSYQQLTTVPVEAFEDVGEFIQTAAGPVLTNSLRPLGPDYYIEQPLTVMSSNELAEHICTSSEEPFVVIDHLVAQTEPLDTSCLEDADGERHTFEQLIRGNRIYVWMVGQ
jgi:hypothetical protein